MRIRYVQYRGLRVSTRNCLDIDVYALRRKVGPFRSGVYANPPGLNVPGAAVRRLHINGKLVLACESVGYEVSKTGERMRYFVVRN